MATRLLIGVTGPSRGIPWAWWAIRWRLHRLGAETRQLTPREGDPGRDFAGFIIAGGNDIAPALYGGHDALARDVDTIRDEFELAVLSLADRQGLPVLGICRGAQLLNVHAGGTLVGDLRSMRVRTSNRRTLLPRKSVTIAPRSLLQELMGTTSCHVNSLHHQAVARPGFGLRVSAWDRDHIIQAIEAPTGPLRLGVQWHPEYLPQRREQRRLFARFLAACAGGAR